MVTQPKQEWVLLNYRIPREPSTPRITVWRKLKELGVIQIGDGLVALPNDARTMERLEWIAESVREADGEAIVWIAVPSARHNSATLAGEMRDARDLEYAALLTDIEEQQETSSRSVQRWRREWRRISRRDYFRSPLRDKARLAIHAAATQAGLAKEKLQ